MLKQIYSLFSKDYFLIRKKLIYIISIPVFFSLLTGLFKPSFGGLPCVALITLVILPMTLQSLLIEESKNPRGGSLLLATPYGKKNIITARYIFLLVEYIVCLMLYSITVLFIPTMEMLSFPEIIVSAITSCCLIAVILPVAYIVKSDIIQKLLFFVPVYIAFGLSAIVNNTTVIPALLSVFNGLSALTSLCAAALLICLSVHLSELYM